MIEALHRPGRVIPLRLALVAVATLFAATAAVAFVVAIPTVWGVDAQRNIDAASTFVDGAFGATPGYLYSPLAAALTTPALLVPPAIAISAWFIAKLLILLAGVAIATRGRERPDRVLAAIIAVAFLPLLYDLEVGNVTVLVLASMALILWNEDQYATGLPLGLLLATVPKPQLIPVLVWMLLVHRKALAGAIVTGAVATAAGVAIAGVAAYAEWIRVLRAPAYLNGVDVKNFALWSLPPWLLWPSLAVALVACFVAVRRGYWAGYLATTCLGLLIAPYTLTYAAGTLLAGVPAAARAAPRATLILAILGPAALPMAFQAWVLAALVGLALVPADRWPTPGRFVS